MDAEWLGGGFLCIFVEFIVVHKIEMANYNLGTSFLR